MVGKERTKKGRHSNPLADDLLSDRFAKMSAKTPVEVQLAPRSEILSSKETKRVFQVAKRHGRPDEEEVDEEELQDDAGVDVQVGDYDEEGEEAESEEEPLEYDDSMSQASEAQSFADLGNEYQINPDDELLLNKFQPTTSVQTRNLADIIMAKIRENEKKKVDEQAGGASPHEGIDKRVAKIYLAIGRVLRSYTAGKIPKAFKVLPHVQNWEQLLLLTQPQEWSPHAVYAATRIFASALNERMAQRFYSAFLLPIIHTAIEERKKLHPAEYQAVRKALFKPVAFYKGFLLPLVTEPEFECSLREALIIGSVLQKCHLPPIPTAVVLVKMVECPFSSAQCVFLRVFIDKKMSLPFQCIDALVLYFHRFCFTHSTGEPLPVLWHQTLLLFVRYYKADFTEAQVELLKQVCLKHFHHLISPEVRRELAVKY